MLLVEINPLHCFVVCRRNGRYPLKHPYYLNMHGTLEGRLDRILFRSGAALRSA